MKLSILPQHITSYILWLQNHQYQFNTIRNYQQDLRVFLAYSNNEISVETILKYFEDISHKNNSKRYLASLAAFCQYLLDQHLTEKNLFKSAKKHFFRKKPFDIDKLLIQYQNYLFKDNKSDITIKNYLNDIHQYFEWLSFHEIRN